jgi:predicted O-methyltransferase YrrM
MRLRYAMALYCLIGMLVGAALSPFSSHTLTTVLVGGLAGVLLMIHRNIKDEVSKAEQRITAAVSSMLPQLHSMVEISKRIDLRAPLPPLRGWAVSYDFAATLISILLEQRPRVVVEASSGVSTILTGYCLEKNGGGRVISLDHEAKYADATNDALTSHKLGLYAKAFHAPLRPYNVSGRQYSWYDMTALESLEGSIDVAVIDGPPAITEPEARHPALPLLIERLSPNAVVLVDDADRAGERKMIRRWIEEYPEFTVQFLPHEKGTAILRREGVQNSEVRRSSSEYRPGS